MKRRRAALEEEGSDNRSQPSDTSRTHSSTSSPTTESSEQVEQNSNLSSQTSNPEESATNESDEVTVETDTDESSKEEDEETNQEGEAEIEEIQDPSDIEQSHEEGEAPFSFLPSFKPDFRLEDTIVQSIHDLGNIWKSVKTTEREPPHPLELCHKLGDVFPNYAPEKLIFELLHCIYSHGENVHLVVHKQSKYDLAYYIINSSNILVQCCLPFLLEHGYNLEPYEEARTNETLLYHSIAIENKFTFFTLLNYGANPDEKFGYCHTTALLKLLMRIDKKIFMESADSFFLQVIQALLGRGANINYRDRNGATPRMFLTQESLTTLFQNKWDEEKQHEDRMKKIIRTCMQDEYSGCEKSSYVNILRFAMFCPPERESSYADLDPKLQEKFFELHSKMQRRCHRAWG